MRISETSTLTINKTPLLKPLRKYNDKLCIKTKSADLIIDKSAISYLKADSNYCRIYLQDGRCILCSKTLKEMTLRINNPRFIKVHSSYLVNVEEIASLDSSYGRITLRDKTVVPVSRARKSGLKELVSLMFD